MTHDVYKDIDYLSGIARGFMQSQTLFVANELGIFSFLGTEKRKKLEDIVSACETDRRATEILLNALVGINLLKKKGDFYENSDITGELLVKGSKYYQGDMLKHLYNVRLRWADLLTVVKSGHPEKTGDEKRRFSQEETRNFIMGMANIGKMSAEKLAPSVDLSKNKKLLDLGGGPGSYAIAFCHKYQSLHATVFDLAEVVPITKEQIEDAKLSERIDTLPGDYLKDEFGGPYDAILISNIIHSLGEKDILTIFKKSFNSLEKNGKIIVKDFFVSEDRTGPEYAMLFAVNMLVATEEGNTYSEKEVTEWLTECGFKDVEFNGMTPHTKFAIGVKR